MTVTIQEYIRKKDRDLLLNPIVRTISLKNSTVAQVKAALRPSKPGIISEELYSGILPLQDHEIVSDRAFQQLTYEVIYAQNS